MNKKLLQVKPSFFDNLMKKDNFFDDFFNFKASLPAVNISEDEHIYKVEIAFPGAKKENFSVQVKNRDLIIKYESKTEDKIEEKNYHKREFSSESFIKTLEVPENCDVENIKSRYENGVLNIDIPKLEIKEEDMKTVNIE